MRAGRVLSSIPMCLAGLMLLAAPAQADSQAAPGAPSACDAVAAAKYQQWRQEKLLIAETKHYVDGKTNDIQMIVTPNTAYAKGSFGPWASVQIVIPERGARSPAQMAHNMQLENCAVTDRGQQDGQNVTAYSYDYKQSLGAMESSGTIWISDSSGLPLKQEMRERGKLANRRVATDISATYKYNAEVQIPLAAELANDTRIWNEQSGLRNMHGGSGVGVH